ncbi:MAG: hypothetical protein E7297_06190 [Lachnospiraceae bacterium]|jgi:hypothetical protein|nr:hypothetical protein [Lachnospiraceae bacterium]
MDFQKDDRIDYLADYRDDMNKLLRYLPWMEEHRSAQVVSTYDGSETQKQSFSFPVYDSTLLSFVREAEKTKLMTKNYPYGYTRNGIRTTEQEIQFIRSARAKNIEDLKCILSKHVLMGRTKGGVWPQAVADGIFAEILTKFTELLRLGV